MRQLIGLSLLSLLLSSLLTGCIVEPRHHRGLLLPPVLLPPVPAPFRHGGVDLLFDNGLGVYAVVGHPDIYFHDNLYWHLRDGRWHTSDVYNGRWVVVDAHARHLPPGLAKKYGYGRSDHRDHDDDRDNDHDRDEHGKKNKHHD